jgi:hypothetical protein
LLKVNQKYPKPPTPPRRSGYHYIIYTKHINKWYCPGHEVEIAATTYMQEEDYGYISEEIINYPTYRNLQKAFGNYGSRCL